MEMSAPLGVVRMVSFLVPTQDARHAHAMTIPILPLMVSNLSHPHRHGNEKLPEGEVYSFFSGRVKRSLQMMLKLFSLFLRQDI